MNQLPTDFTGKNIQKLSAFLGEQYSIHLSPVNMSIV